MSEPLFRAEGLTKQYGQVKALQGADFDVAGGRGRRAHRRQRRRQVDARADAVRQRAAGRRREIWFDGRPVVLGDPIQARSLGIETVFQDLALAPPPRPDPEPLPGPRGHAEGPARQARVHGHRRHARSGGKKTFAGLGPPSATSPAHRRHVRWAEAVHRGGPRRPLGQQGDLPRRTHAALGRRADQGRARPDPPRPPTRASARGLHQPLHAHVLEVSDRVQVMRHGRRWPPTPRRTPAWSSWWGP